MEQIMACRDLYYTQLLAILQNKALLGFSVTSLKPFSCSVVFLLFLRSASSPPILGGGDKWVKSKTVRWTPPGLFSG